MSEEMLPPPTLSGATPDQLQEAAALNHTEMFVLDALAGGDEVCVADGVTWTGAGGPGAQPMIAFPRLDPASEGPLLDRIVASYLDCPPEKLVGCWSLDPPRPVDLEALLLARGFQLGWRPCWMALDLADLKSDHAQPPGLVVEITESDDPWDVSDLPYYNAAATIRQNAAARLKPRRLWRFAAWLDGRPVGHCTLVLTTGPLGAAGIYGVGVTPAMRKQGIGKAVVGAACRHARSLGWRYAVLNATGEKMYRQLGFETVGEGWTWWLNVPRLKQRSVSSARIALAEAVGRGLVQRLDRIGAGLTPEELDLPLPAGMTLLQLAVHTRQPASIDWLIAHGATLDVISAWDLGWKERVPGLLADRPDLANRPWGEAGYTPLHAAIERDDPDLAKALLDAGADLQIEDPAYHSTAAGWARFFQRSEILKLIEERNSPSAPPGPSPLSPADQNAD